MRTIKQWASCTIGTPETRSLHVGGRAFATFGDETIDPRGNNGQRYRAELEHCIVERADVELRCERFAAFSRTHTIASELATLKT